MSWGVRVIKDDLTPTLQKLRSRMEGMYLHLEMLKIVQDMVASAKTMCPVRSGYLRSTIEANIDGLQITFAALAHYAVYVEFGTWKMRANPFMRTALEQHEGQIYAAIGRTLFS